MNAKLTHVPLAVHDQAQALEYYTKKIGFEKRADSKGPTGARWLTVAPKGSEIEFALIAGKAARVDGSDDPRALQIALSTTDCRGDYEAMKARGVLFDIPGHETPQRSVWGTAAYFRDPDGNAFSMVQQSWIGKMMVKAMGPKKTKKE